MFTIGLHLPVDSLCSIFTVRQLLIIYSTVHLQPAFIKDVNFMCSNNLCVCLHLAVFTDFNNTLVLAKPGKQNTLSFKKDKCVTWETTSSTEKKQTYSFSILAQLATTTHTSVSSLFLTRVPRISRREGFMRNIFDLKHPIIADSALLL